MFSFPGGRVDEVNIYFNLRHYNARRVHQGESFFAAALRETHEELGIPPSCIEILGQIGPPEVNLRGDMNVWPYVV